MCILPFQTPPDCSKSRSVAAAATAIAESGLVIGAFFLILGVTDVVDRIARCQAASWQGCNLVSLAGLGIRLIETQRRSDLRADALSALAGCARH